MIDIKIGDVFLVKSKSILSPLTNFFQKLWSKDNISNYNHAGIIIDNCGKTLEVRWTVCSKVFLKFYAGKEVLIARPKFESDRVMNLIAGINAIIPFEGKYFPVHRMILHALRLAKFIHWHSVVCSELVAKYMHAIGIRHNYWWGTTVDDLEEEIKNWKQYEIVYEGRL